MRVAWLTKQGWFTLKTIKVRAGKDGKDRTTRPFCHPTFKAIIILAAFIPMDSIAHLKSGPLNPIGLETLAFCWLCNIQCFDEYTATGTHTYMPMEDVVYQERWTWLHSNALTWSKLKAARCAELQKAIYKEGMQGIDSGLDNSANTFINDDTDSDKGDNEAQVASGGVK
ncbi:hypothetical protein K439DRAFT_1624816 [Ramaria rubella]|nr:hypothetical protein K439DRAFT_1624816 [Ramaria rubella]